MRWLLSMAGLGAFVVLALTTAGSGVAGSRSPDAAAHRPPVVASFVAGVRVPGDTAIPISELIPRRTVALDVWPLQATRTIGQGAIVLWTRGVDGPKSPSPSDRSWQGLLAWQYDSVRGGWRRLWADALSDPQYIENLIVRTGDATGDRYPDLLLAFRQGSSDCGPTEVVQIGRLHAATILRAPASCDNRYQIGRGHLILWHEFGGCPGGQIHCYLAARMTTYRWNGRRFVSVASHEFCLIAFYAAGRRACRRARVPITKETAASVVGV
jgi:hypothetical protein